MHSMTLLIIEEASTERMELLAREEDQLVSRESFKLVCYLFISSTVVGRVEGCLDLISITLRGLAGIWLTLCSPILMGKYCSCCNFRCLRRL